MKQILPVASGLLLSVILPISTVAQTNPTAEILEERTQAQICQYDPLDDLGGNLTGRDAGSRINIRAGAGTQHPVQHQAIVGDEVEDALEGTVATDGYCWFRVRLTGSGVVGWVRNDFVELMFPDLSEDGEY